jgi:hypothetical protein
MGIRVTVQGNSQGFARLSLIIHGSMILLGQPVGRELIAIPLGNCAQGQRGVVPFHGRCDRVLAGEARSSAVRSGVVWPALSGSTRAQGTPGFSWSATL